MDKKKYEIEATEKEFNNICDYLKIKNTIFTKELQEKNTKLTLQTRTFECKHKDIFTKGIYDAKTDTLKIVFGITNDTPKGTSSITTKIHI